MIQLLKVVLMVKLLQLKVELLEGHIVPHPTLTGKLLVLFVVRNAILRNDPPDH